MEQLTVFLDAIQKYGIITVFAVVVCFLYIKSNRAHIEMYKQILQETQKESREMQDKLIHQNNVVITDLCNKVCDSLDKVIDVVKEGNENLERKVDSLFDKVFMFLTTGKNSQEVYEDG